MPIVLGLLLSKQLRIDYSYPGFNRLEVDGYVSSRGLAQFLGEGLPVSSLDFDLPSRIESRLEVDSKFATILTAGIEGFNYIAILSTSQVSPGRLFYPGAGCCCHTWATECNWGSHHHKGTP